MSNTFTNRYGRKYGLFVKGFDRIAPEYATKKQAYNWDNPIWRRERLKMLRRKHQHREMKENNPNWLQERYPNWDWRTEEERRWDWTVGKQ